MPTVEKVAGLDAKRRRVYEGQLKARISHFWHEYRESKRGLVGLIMVGGLIFTSVALMLEHRRISKLKVSGRDLEKFIGKQNKK